MIDVRTNEPFLSLWLGNFFEPTYSDRAFVAEAVRDIRRMGFNQVLLDSKSWQDFFDRYAGGEASPYVAQQEYMMECIRREGMSHYFLAIYMNGDNLYPLIRYSPAVIGEGVVGPDGQPRSYYKYWSPRAQQSMADHVAGLLKLYRGNHGEVRIGGEERLPICSMWDPVAAPSFDEDGIGRYRCFLRERYGRIEALNERYGASLADFDRLDPQTYWQREPVTAADSAKRTPAFWKHVDNLLYLQWELERYFKAMRGKLHAVEGKLLLMPNLSQWSIFLNINRQDPGDLWDTANRGVDPYRLAKYLDMATFMTVPMTPDAEPNPYASEYQNAMMRAMNPGREFAVGFYLGRHMANDIYREITPAEIIGSAVASGAAGIHAYGYCGLDDGGVMHKLNGPFKASIAAGNRWAKTVLPRIRGERRRQVAVLYPAQMALVEGFTTAEGNQRRRLDSLGCFQAVCDSGLMADVLHPDQVAAGALKDYAALVLPQNSCYDIAPDPLLEERIRAFVEAGGLVFRSALEPLAGRVFGIEERPHGEQCIRFGEGLIPAGTDYSAYALGEPLARFEDDGLAAVARFDYGRGAVYAFGYAIGAEYLARENRAVPVQYGNRAYYPLNLVAEDPFRVLLRRAVPSLLGAYRRDGTAPAPDKGISYAAFGNGLVAVNHTSYPLDMAGFKGRKFYLHAAAGDQLPPHSAVWIESE